MLSANAFKARGTSGRLAVGYQRAAALGAWRLDAIGTLTWVVDAALADGDDYWLAQRPIDCELDIGPTRWKWRVAALAVDAGRVRATLTGRPERR